MYEPPKSKHLPGNPYAGYAMTSNDPAEVMKSLTYEVRTLIMILHPYYDHNVTKERMTDHEQ